MVNQSIPPKFKGPVRPGDNENLFRITGITRKKKGYGGGDIKKIIEDREREEKRKNKIQEIKEKTKETINEIANKLKEDISKRGLTRSEKQNILKASRQEASNIKTSEMSQISQVNKGNLEPEVNMTLANQTDKKVFTRGGSSFIIPEKEFNQLTERGKTQGQQLQTIRDNFTSMGEAPKSEVFEKRQIDSYKGIPITAYFSVETGEKASPKQETQLRKQESQNKELVIDSSNKVFFKNIDWYGTFTGDSTSGQQFVEQKAVGFLDKASNPFVTPISKGVSLLSAGKIKEESVENILRTKTTARVTDIGKFALFTPAIMTGTSQLASQESVYAETIVNGRRVFVKKADLKDFLNAPVTRQAGKKVTIEGPSNAIKFNRARTLYNNARDPEAQKKILKVIEEEYGKTFLQDFLQQEGIQVQRQTTNVLGLQTKPQTTQKINQQQLQTAELEQVGQVSSGSSQVLRSGEISSLRSRQNLFFDSKTAQDTQTQQRTNQLFASASAFSPSTSTTTKQTTSTKFFPSLSFNQPQRTKQRLRVKTRFGLKKSSGGKGTLKGKIKTPNSEGSSGGLLSISSLRRLQKGYIPQVKQEERWINVTKKPRTKEEALALAGYIVDNSTSAQLRLKESKKKVKSKTLRKRIDYNKFRDYKVMNGKRQPLDRFGLIEKRTFRIDTPGEKRELKASQVMKSKPFISLLKPKKKQNKIKFL